MVQFGGDDNFNYPHRLEEIMTEVNSWLCRSRYSWVQLESLLGKLQFVANCVRPGRVLVMRLHNALRDTSPGLHVRTTEMRKDIDWWRKFLPSYNGVSLM